MLDIMSNTYKYWYHPELINIWKSKQNGDEIPGNDWEFSENEFENYSFSENEFESNRRPSSKTVIYTQYRMAWCVYPYVAKKIYLAKLQNKKCYFAKKEMGLIHSFHRIEAYDRYLFRSIESNVCHTHAHWVNHVWHSGYEDYVFIEK